MFHWVTVRGQKVETVLVSHGSGTVVDVLVWSLAIRVPAL